MMMYITLSSLYGNSENFKFRFVNRMLYLTSSERRLIEGADTAMVGLHAVDLSASPWTSSLNKTNHSTSYGN